MDAGGTQSNPSPRPTWKAHSWRSKPRGVAGLAVAGLLLGGTLGAACGGSSSSTPSASKKMVQVDLLNPLSGGEAAYSASLYGAESYFSWANAHGGVNGYKFSWKMIDDQSDAAVSATEAKAAVQQGALALIVNGTPPTDGVRSVLGQLSDTPVVALASGNEIAPPTVPNFFGELPNYSEVAAFDARFIIQKFPTKAKNVALVYESDGIGQPSSTEFPKYIQQHGGKVITSVGVSLTTTDFSPYASRLKASGASVVEVEALAPVLAGLEKAAAAIGYSPTWVTSFYNSSPFLQLAGPLAVGTYEDGYMESVHAPTPEAQTFLSWTEAHYPKDASFPGDQGWTAAATVAKGIQLATANGKPLTRSSLDRGLESINDMQVGLVQHMTFSPSNHVGITKLAMYKVVTGPKLSQVAPFSNVPSL